MNLPEIDHPALTAPTGEAPETAGFRTLRLVNPADGIAIADMSLDGDIDAAVTAAAAALPAWSGLTPQDRASRLLALADRIEAHQDELVAIESRNVGKPLSAVREEVGPWVDCLRFAAGAARIAAGNNAGEYLPGTLSYLRREPIGVVGLIAPWNYPLLEAIWKIAPALAAGNTAVLKPSELTPFTTIRLGQLAEDLLPPGTLTILLGDGRVGEELVQHRQVAMVSLTGDVSTGMTVATTAARGLKRVHLELGGKAPVLILDDVDPASVARTIAPLSYVNAGQDCTAACRIIVAEALHDRFVEEFVAATRDVRLGDPSDEKTELGPVVSQRQLQRISTMVDNARAAGAEVHCGGRPADRPGFFYEATVLTGLDQNAEAIQKEIFGPVVTIQKATSDDEMLQMANDVVYGLSASVWTNDLTRSNRFTAQLNFGTVWVNQHLLTISEMPFGGFGHSGYGKEQSTHSIDDYSRFKHVMVGPAV